MNKGFEINGRWQPARVVSLTVGYGYLHSTNPAPYVPDHKLNYSLDLNAGRIFLSLSGIFVDKTWGDIGKSLPLDEYSLMTFKWTVPLKKHISMFATVDNLLNHGYQVIAGYPMPGINVNGGLRFKF